MAASSSAGASPRQTGRGQGSGDTVTGANLRNNPLSADHVLTSALGNAVEFDSPTMDQSLVDLSLESPSVSDSFETSHRGGRRRPSLFRRFLENPERGISLLRLLVGGIGALRGGGGLGGGGLGGGGLGGLLDLLQDGGGGGGGRGHGRLLDLLRGGGDGGLGGLLSALRRGRGGGSSRSVEVEERDSPDKESGPPVLVFVNDSNASTKTQTTPSNTQASSGVVRALLNAFSQLGDRASPSQVQALLNAASLLSGGSAGLSQPTGPQAGHSTQALQDRLILARFAQLLRHAELVRTAHALTSGLSSQGYPAVTNVPAPAPAAQPPATPRQSSNAQTLTDANLQTLINTQSLLNIHLILNTQSLLKAHSAPQKKAPTTTIATTTPTPPRARYLPPSRRNKSAEKMFFDYARSFSNRGSPHPGQLPPAVHLAVTHILDGEPRPPSRHTGHKPVRLTHRSADHQSSSTKQTYPHRPAPPVRGNSEEGDEFQLSLIVQPFTP